MEVSCKDNNKKAVTTTKASKQWLVQANKTLAKFLLALILLYTCLFGLNAWSLPPNVSYLILVAIFLLLFVMVILLARDSALYNYCKKSTWGQVAAYIFVAVLSTVSYLWAAGEVNRLFLVNPSNLALTLTFLAAKRFFEYAVIALLASYVLTIGVAILSGLFSSVSSRHQTIAALSKPLVLAALLLLSIGVIGIAAERVSELNDGLVQSLAVKVDFSQYHTCKGDDFDDIDGVLFLSAADILVAKQTAHLTWQFKKVHCK